jgi:hypothetical protein
MSEAVINGEVMVARLLAFKATWNKHGSKPWWGEDAGAICICRGTRDDVQNQKTITLHSHLFGIEVPPSPFPS